MRVEAKLLGMAGERPDEMHKKETYMAPGEWWVIL